MTLTKAQEVKIMEYLEEKIQCDELVNNGHVRVDNFDIHYQKTVNEQFDPEHPDDGDPEWWFDIDIINDVNCKDDDHFGTSSQTPFYNTDADLVDCFENALSSFFCELDWTPDEVSLKTLGF